VRAQTPISALASLIDALSADSATGLRRHGRDATLVNFKDATLEPSEDMAQSLSSDLGVRIRHNWYLDCGATDGAGARLARVYCGLREFAHYIDIVDFIPRGDSASADMIVSRLAEQAHDPRPWYRRLGGALATTLTGHTAPHPPIWFRRYSVTFSRGSDGQWVTATVHPWQSIEPPSADAPSPTDERQGLSRQLANER
jgi:hypothetical protein